MAVKYEDVALEIKVVEFDVHIYQPWDIWHNDRFFRGHP